MMYAHTGLMHKTPHATIAFIEARGDQGGTSPWTFSSMGIGTAAADRFVIVGVFAPSTSTASADAISGVTIGGVAATRLAAINTTSTNHQIAFYGLLVTTGTTANIVVSTSAARASMSIAVWAATKLLSTTVRATASDVAVAGSVLAASIAVPAGGVVLGISQVQANPATCTWANITEVVDSPFPTDPAASSAQTGASDAKSTATTVSATATWTAVDAGGDNALLLIAMR